MEYSNPLVNGWKPVGKSVSIRLMQLIAVHVCHPDMQPSIKVFQHRCSQNWIPKMLVDHGVPSILGP